MSLTTKKLFMQGSLIAALLTGSWSAQALLPDTPIGYPTLRAGLNLMHHAPVYDTVEDLSEGAYLAGVSITMPLSKISSSWSDNLALGVRADWVYHDATFYDTVQLQDGTSFKRHTAAQVQRLRLYPEVSYKIPLQSNWDLQLGAYLGVARDTFTGTRTNAATGAKVDDNPLPVDLGSITYSVPGVRATLFYKDWGFEISVAEKVLGVSLVLR